MWNQIKELLTYNPQAPMVFNSGLFLWLFAAFFLVYILLQHQRKARMLFVLLFSYYFYYKSSGTYFFLLAFVTVSDFLIARRMSLMSSKASRRLMVALSVAIDLSLLGYFKYTNFFAGILSSITGGTFGPFDIFLPVGISFFTFQSLSYTIDVYRGTIKPLGSLLDYAFYVSFFPQLVAGPIVRARDFIPQLYRPIVVTDSMMGRGIALIVAGLIKKVVISDYISVNFVDRVFDNPLLYSGIENLMAVYGYTLQIYCDFSGYSDMAIGIALLLGFHFNINFDSPYKSASVTEFWHRWHISLSSWLKDYLYISLGGNRRGKIRQYANLIITMLLGGLWHGASWNFVLWGFMHGVALALHKGFRSLLGRDKHYVSTGWRKAGAVLLTFHFACLCWIFFRQRDLLQAFDMIGQIFCNFSLHLLPQVVAGYRVVFVLMALGYAAHFVPDRWMNGFNNMVTRLPLLGKALLLVAAIWLVIQMKGTAIQPFIYFQF